MGKKKTPPVVVWFPRRGVAVHVDRALADPSVQNGLRVAMRKEEERRARRGDTTSD